MDAVKSLPVWAVSLGCPKNRVDTERLLGSLGLPVVIVPELARSRLAFINTCAFIEPATRESIRAIIEAAEKVSLCKRRPRLVVAGCLPGRYGLTELKAEFPEVDLWLTPDMQELWPDLLAELLGSLPAGGRLLSTGPSYAWLKIADGCNHRCSFCVIPEIRGAHRSGSLESILTEAENLLAQGVKELDIVAQDVLSWGHDLNGDKNIAGLLQELVRLPGLAWLRLLYLYPNAITSSFLENFAAIGKPLLPYFDIPFQHSEKGILRLMGRPYHTQPKKIVRLIRSILPESVLRATLIVGFPGETEADFAKLCEFVRETRFHNLGVFVFHAEDGARAASLPDQIPKEIAEERRNIIMEIQAAISRDILAGYVGTNMEVLVDGDAQDQWPGLYTGRVWFQAPEIDGQTYISGAGVFPGGMPNAEIVDSQIYDLSALC